MTKKENPANSPAVDAISTNPPTADFAVEIWDISAVTPYDKNPRLNDKAVDAVAGSLREFGFRQPIVVDPAGVIIAGHTRFKAAVKLGLSKVPVHVAKDLTPEQVRAYRIADNKTGEISEWNFEILPIELSELRDAGFDMTGLGFSDKELTKLLEVDLRQGETDPDAVPEPPDEPVTQKGDLWILGDHRLLCGDSASEADVDLLLDGALINATLTDPPYNVCVCPRSEAAVAAGGTHVLHPVSNGKKPTPKKLRPKDRPLTNDFLTDEAFAELLHRWFANISRVMVPGGTFYIWGGYANIANYPPALKANGLYFSNCIVWDKMHPVLTRKDFLGAFELCQPPETLVLTPEGEKRISDLKDGDSVVTFSQSSSIMLGYRNGPKVRVGERHYTGELYEVQVGDKKTRCTDGHRFSVKLVPNAREIWGVYLMRRGRWWRVGKTKLLTTWGLGVKQRLEKEKGDEAWILSTHATNTDAMCEEQIVSVRYGIPTTFWTESRSSRRSSDQIDGIYAQLDSDAMQTGAFRALKNYHRRPEYPFIKKGKTRTKYGRRISFVTEACNILPGAMMVPVPAEEHPKFNWTTIDSVQSSFYSGKVYSLDVEKHHHYVADGIVTHNCFYGWKEGAGHHFYGPNNVKDIWEVKKVNPAAMQHLTEKPVELAVRSLQYSSKPGDNILELFGGSGSTLIGCEQTSRRCYAMEIDQLYCDVIVKRWEEFTGRKAVRVTKDAAVAESA